MWVSMTFVGSNEATAVAVEQKIREDYYPLLVNLHDHFQEMIQP